MRQPSRPTRAAAVAARPRPGTARRAPLMLGTALGAVLTLGYGRGAYGQQLCLGGPPDFTCAGSSIDEQFLSVFGNNLNATALTGFQVNSSGNNGLRFLTAFGDLTFTDSTMGSVISGAVNGMNLSAEIGSLTVTANGTVVGNLGSGIRASVIDGDVTHGLTVTTGATSIVRGYAFGMQLRQFGMGGLTVTANGRVEGTDLAAYGIDARIVATDNASALTVSTGAISDIRGGIVGIDARHAGTGEVSVTVNGSVTASPAVTSYGVDARMTNAANASTLLVTTSAGSSITAQFVGLRATHYGTGPLNATVDGSVIASGTSGIGVETRIINTTSAETLTLSTGTSSLIQGGQTAINAMHYGLGDVTVTARGTVTGTGVASAGLAARVINAGSSGNISVTTQAGSTVSGGLRGIMARHAGAGAVGVTVNGTVSATSAGSTGVYALAAGPTGAAPLTVTTGAGSSVSGGGLGLYARHSGLGSVDVMVAGTVSATTTLASTAIYARISNAANAAPITVTTEPGSGVIGDSRGIVARHQGTGELTVSVGGTVTGTNSTGVRAHVDNLTSGGTLTVTTGAASAITGYDRGITALHDGTGAIGVTVDGSVEGTTTTSMGVYARAYNAANAAALTVTTGATSSVTGLRRGVYALHEGTGAVGVTVNGQVQATGANSFGIEARSSNATNAAALTVATGAASSVTGDLGIYARHQGTGALSVTANGAVTGTVAYGISARIDNTAATGALTVTTGAASSITGPSRGIYALQSGAGALSATIDGTVLAAGGNSTGLRARIDNATNASALTVTTGAGSSVTGARYAISATTSGRGAVGVTVAGAVEGTGADSIGVQAIISNYASTGALTVTSATGSNVTGLAFGIYSRHSGAGAHTVTIDGMVEGTAAGSRGVYARSSNATNAAAMSVTTGAGSQVSGGYNGLDARHEGTGALSVTVNGAVDGLATSSDGVVAIAANANTSAMTVTTGAASDISGGNNGLRAFQQGTGALTVTIGGTVEGRVATGAGVLARTFTLLNTSTLTVETLAGSSVSGGANGIYALNQSRGALVVMIAGTVEGTAADSNGLFARSTNPANASAITITTAAGSSVSGGTSGIRGRHNGLGALSVTVNGTVAGTFLDAIGISAEAVNPDNLAALSVTAGAGSSVTGDGTGIHAIHSGLGSVSVTADGSVEGVHDAGIAATIYNPASTAALSITAGAGSSVSGASRGINALHDGLGALSVTADGTVAATGAGSYGIRAQSTNIANAEALSVTMGAGSAVSGSVYGLRAVHNGLGAVGVTLGGTVDSTDGTAIAAQIELATSTAALSVTTADGSRASGRTDAIYARQIGTGALSVTANGTLVGTEDAGIDAFVGNAANAAALAVTTGANSRVQGHARGILAVHTGTGALTVAAGAQVSGTALDSEGIDAWIVNPGSSAALTVQTGAGSIVSGGADGILARHAGSGAVVVSVAGVVIGGSGAAIRTQAAGASGQAITVAATGSVVGVSGQAIVAEGAAVTIENFGEITGGVTLTGAADLFDNRGLWVAAGQTSAFGGGADRVENRGTLVAANAGISILSTAAALPASVQMTLLQDLDTFVNLGGLILLQNGVSGDVLEISGDFVADGGVLALDVEVAGNASAADRLVIGGDAQRAGAATGIHVTQTAAAGDRDEDGILLVQVAGTSAADAFTLANPAPLELGAFVYELTLGGCDGAGGSDWYLCATDQPGSIATLYEAAPAVLLGGFATLPSLFERLRQRQPMGEGVEATRGPSILPGPDSRFGGVWMRLHGERAEVTPQTSTAAATFRRSGWGLQLGAELLVAEGDGGDWVLGATAQYGRVSATVRNAVGTGQITGQGWGIGFTATWQGLGGTYVDLQGQANRVSVDYSTAAQGLLASDVTARTRALSAEIGHRHALSPDLTLVPQAQLAWGSVDGGSFTDALGNAVVLGRGSTTSGRIGLAWEYSPAGPGPEAPTVYGILNIRHEFSAPGAVSVAGTPLLMRPHPTQGEIGLGGIVPLAPNAVLFGQASYRAPFGAAGGNRTLSASAGLRVRW